MPKIGILDDREPQRQTMHRTVEAEVPEGWQPIDVPLFEELTKYPVWLVNNDVQVLLADFVLDEQAAEEGSGAANYKADAVIAAIRDALPDFPVFILTAFPKNADLQRTLGSAEAVMNRRRFGREATENVERMVRAGRRFAREYERNLAELGKLAEKAASGNADAAELEQLRSLQTALGLGLSAAGDVGRSEALDRFEAKLSDFEKLRGEIERLLKQRSE
ncbi:MAG: hypothetical protein ABR589_06340 [Chthoniobacterales bacterium]